MMERELMEYAANAVWQIPLLAVGAWLLLAALKAGPRVQHGVWLAVLGLAVVLPLHGMSSGGSAEVYAGEGAREALAAPVVVDRDVQVTMRQRMEWMTSPRSVVLPVVVGRWMVGLYGGALVLGMLRVMRAWQAARRLVEGSRAIELPVGQAMVIKDYGRRMRIRLPQVRESVEVESPMIVGMLAPVLLLPEEFARHAEDEVKAALLHELAHVKRRDYAVNAICQVVGLPVVWHPVTHWVQGRIRRTREMACDAMAAREMRSEIGYARCLLSLAQEMVGAQEMEGQTVGVGLFGSNVLFGKNVLEERMMRLMETKVVMSVRTKVVRALSGATAMAAAASMAMMFHVVPTMAASHGAHEGQSNVVAEVQALPAAASVAPVAPVAASSVVAAPAQAVDAMQAKEAAEAEGTIAVEAKRAGEVQAVDAVEAKKAVEAKAAATGKASCSLHSSKVMVMDGKGFTIVDGERRELTPEERQRLEKDLAASKEHVAAAMAKVNSPEFKQRMADAQAQAAKAEAEGNSAEFKQRMDAARQQAAEAAARMNSAEYRHQIEEATRAASAVHELDMAKMNQEIAKATVEVNSPEFKRQMADMQKIQGEEVQRALQDAMRSLKEAEIPAVEAPSK